MSSIVLIGYRGTGKSAVANRLATATGRVVFHMDDAITVEIGMPITEYVACHGWEAFRAKETEAACRAGRMAHAVIDTGGGVILREENMIALKQNGAICWLQATPATIRMRLRYDTSRPPLTSGRSFLEEIEDVLREREPLYRKYADFAVQTDDRSIASIVDAIIRLESDMPAVNHPNHGDSGHARTDFYR